MSTWNHGYNTDLGYTYGYYREQDPAWLEFCAILRGATPPSQLAEGKLRYLELGCGQGVNLCLIAAVHPHIDFVGIDFNWVFRTGADHSDELHPHIDFVGIDFNPAHIAHAQGLAKAAGLANVRFVEGDFLALGERWPAELGQFHYASAHGIYSWIPPKVAQGFVQCLEKATLPGALIYLSYNTQPGWISTLPVQHLLRLWQVREGLPSLKAIEVGRERLAKLVEVNSAMSRALPGLKVRLEKFPTLDKSYLIQEYLHDNWLPRWFDEVASELAPAKLNYLTTATASDWYLPAILPPEWKAILAQYTDTVERELMLDVLINQSFRRDLWVRGQPPLWPDAQRAHLLSIRFQLLNRPQPKDEGDNPYKFQTSLGEVSGKPEVYTPLYDVLASGPKTVGELANLPPAAPGGNPAAVTTPASGTPPKTLADTLQALGFMLHAGHVALTRPSNDKLAKTAQALNRAIFAAVWQGAPYKNLVAPAIPWVLGASDGDLMLGYARLTHPKADAAQLGRLWAQQLKALGRGLAKDGQPLTTPEAIEARAVELADVFLTKTWPTWQRLGVG